MDALDPTTLRELFQYVYKDSGSKKKRPNPKKVNLQYAQEDAAKRISELEGKLQKFDTSAGKRMWKKRKQWMAAQATDEAARIPEC